MSGGWCPRRETDQPAFPDPIIIVDRLYWRRDVVRGWLAEVAGEPMPSLAPMTRRSCLAWLKRAVGELAVQAGEAVVVGAWLRAQARRGNRYESYFIDIADGTRLLRELAKDEPYPLLRFACDGLAVLLPRRCRRGRGGKGLDAAVLHFIVRAG